MGQLTISRPGALSAADAGGAVTSNDIDVGSDAPDTVENDGRVKLRVSNSNNAAAPTNAYVVVRSRIKSNQGHLNHVVAAVAKNATEVLGPFPPSRFGDTLAIYYTSAAPATDADFDKMGFAIGTDLATELTSAEAAEVHVEVI